MRDKVSTLCNAYIISLCATYAARYVYSSPAYIVCKCAAATPDIC
jgi:hypothetical protein